MKRLAFLAVDAVRVVLTIAHQATLAVLNTARRMSVAFTAAAHSEIRQRVVETLAHQIIGLVRQQRVVVLRHKRRRM